MSRRKRHTLPAEVYDHGPDIQRDRGEVAVKDAPDIDNPNRTIRQAKRVWVPDVLLSNKTISQAHHDAATRLHDAYALGILGARDRLQVYVDRTSSPTGYADAQLAAATDYRRAVQAVGIRNMPALDWCVIGHGSIASWADMKGWSKDRACGYLLSALDRLAEHYGLT